MSRCFSMWTFWQNDARQTLHWCLFTFSWTVSTWTWRCCLCLKSFWQTWHLNALTWSCTPLKCVANAELSPNRFPQCSHSKRLICAWTYNMWWFSFALCLNSPSQKSQIKLFFWSVLTKPFCEASWLVELVSGVLAGAASLFWSRLWSVIFNSCSMITLTLRAFDRRALKDRLGSVTWLCQCSLSLIHCAKYSSVKYHLLLFNYRELQIRIEILINCL